MLDSPYSIPPIGGGVIVGDLFADVVPVLAALRPHLVVAIPEALLAAHHVHGAAMSDSCQRNTERHTRLESLRVAP